MKQQTKAENYQPTPRWRSVPRRSCSSLLGALLIGLLSHTASAQVTNNFADGNGNTTANQFPGIDGPSDGWADKWTNIFNTGNNGNATGYFARRPGEDVNPVVTNLNSFPGSGGYLNFGLANGESAIMRKYTSNGTLDITLPHIIEFDLRVDAHLGTWSSGSDKVTVTGKRTFSNADGSDSLWWFKAVGQNDSGKPGSQTARWNFYHGSDIDNGSSAGDMVSSTNVPFLFGTNYHFRIDQDNSTKTWKATVSTTVTNVSLSFTTPTPLRWRNYRTTSAADLTNGTVILFGSRVSTVWSNNIPLPGPTETNIVSIDNLRIWQLADILPPKITVVTPEPAEIFHRVASNLVFSVLTTGPTNTIPTANVSLTLNGVNVSGSLGFGSNPTNRTVTYSGLVVNTIYSNATITVTDQAGRSATTTFFFDTFDETKVTVIEAENYNFQPNVLTSCGGYANRTNNNSDGYIQNPLPAGYDAVNDVYTNWESGYAQRQAVAGVDYLDVSPTERFSDYRLCDTFDTRTKPSLEYFRPSFIPPSPDFAMSDFVLEHLDAGDWANYTHNFANSNYYVYLRAGARNATVHYQLSKVTSDPQQPNQTTALLGTFTVPALPARETLKYVPLADAFGNPILLHLNGEETLRLTVLDANTVESDDTYANFLLFDGRAGSFTPPYLIQYFPETGTTNTPPQTEISASMRNGSSGSISIPTIALRVNGVNVTSSSVITFQPNGVAISYLPPTLFPTLSYNTVQLVYGDGSGPLQTNQWSFHVGTYMPGTVVRVRFQQPASTNYPGYFPDTSLTFNNRGNGMSYGWDRDFTQDTRESYPTVNSGNNAVPPDARYAAFTHLNKSSPPRVWGITLPNGNYSVHAVSGDPTAIDSIYKIAVEGVLVVDGTPSWPQNWVEGTQPVVLSDGRLTLTTPGANNTVLGGNNNKINFIDITPLDYPAPNYQLINPIKNGSTFSFTFQSISRAQHIIEYKNRLTDPSWTVLTNIVGTGSSIVVNDPAGISRAYRMRIP